MVQVRRISKRPELPINPSGENLYEDAIRFFSPSLAGFGDNSIDTALAKRPIRSNVAHAIYETGTRAIQKIFPAKKDYPPSSVERRLIND